MEIFRKEIDWSVLVDGMNIPLGVQAQLYNALGFELKRGESRDIHVLFNKTYYTASLRNLPMNSNPDRFDMVHLRYSRNSELAHKLQLVYRDQFNYFITARSLSDTRSHIRLPDELFIEMIVCAEEDLIIFL